ncbi:hypothetical protein ABTD37_20375, partial [Acinetobacter baumannii]
EFPPPLNGTFERIKRRRQPAGREFDVTRPGWGRFWIGKTVGTAISHHGTDALRTLARHEKQRTGKHLGG